MKDKKIKIIFLDFTGTIDKPFTNGFVNGAYDPTFHEKGEAFEEPWGNFAEEKETEFPAREHSQTQPTQEDLENAKAEDEWNQAIKNRDAGHDPYHPVTDDNNGNNPGYAGVDKNNGFWGARRSSENRRLRITHGYFGEEHEWGGGGHNYPVYKDEPNSESVKYLKQLVDKTGAKIVFSTTRRYSGWKSCAEYVGLPDEYFLGHDVYGVTPTHVEPENKKGYIIEWINNIPFFKKKDKATGTEFYYKPRQREIKQWLKDWKAANGAEVESYVILDDDVITDPVLEKHWVASVQHNRFLEEEYHEALKILQKKA